ncbi:MAG: histidine--tRNA ligase [Thermoproteota archaeon]|nr:histidine--tRNA ligase [Thermoproteota archaeon]
MARLELPRGMRDLDPEEYANINYVRDRFFEIARLFNFQLAEPSPLEMLATLEAKSGAAISKEIYAFKDKGGRDVALRFDLTVGLTRYIESRRDLKMPTKLASFAGVWRYDEPQAERYRYFHQWDIEVYGPFSQESDAEIIEFVYMFFKNLGLNVAIEINDRQLLEQYIVKKLGISSQETMLEMFRAVDKVPKKGEQAVLAEYKDKIKPTKMQALIELSKLKGNVDEVASKADVSGLGSWQQLVHLMDLLKAKKVEGARINLGIVRGLDYYSGVVFEAFDPTADSGALVGGGRYNRLTEAFGRKDIGASGVAGGVERIVIALKRHGLLKQHPRPLVYIANATEELRAKTLELASSLRAGGIAVDYDMLGRALKKQLEYASNKGTSFVIIVAPNEIAMGQVILRSMKDGTENKYYVDSLRETLSNMLTV